MLSCEQQARDMLERIGDPSAQQYSSGNLVELANLINNMSRFKVDVAYMPVPRCETCKYWTSHTGACTEISIDAPKMPRGSLLLITTADFGCVRWKAKS